MTTHEREYEFFASPEDAAVGWTLFQFALRGLDHFINRPIPPMPGTRVVNKALKGTGVFARVKEAVPVDELAGRFTRLQYAGPDRLKGKCPLHEDKTPSFVIWQTSNTWRCFGACARGGDVIELARLLMDTGKLT